jgi:hypothetical protein
VLPHSLRRVQEAIVDDPSDCLVSINFCLWDAATSQDYDNVDMSLDVSVLALYFACNRPTIAALMCFGQDIVFEPAAVASAAPLDAGAGATAALSAEPSAAAPLRGVLPAFCCTSASFRRCCGMPVLAASCLITRSNVLHVHLATGGLVAPASQPAHPVATFPFRIRKCHPPQEDFQVHAGQAKQICCR